MYSKYQRGELSLFWCAVFAALVAAVAMAGLFSMRYERNLFAEGWSRLMRNPVLQQTQQAAEQATKPESAAVRKCTINGQVVYSNVECSASTPNSRKVELHDSRGFDAPKAPPASASQADGPTDMKEKMIERAVQR